MNIAVIGTGQLGLATAVSLAQCDHDVLCVDRNAHRAAQLSDGAAPFAEAEFNDWLRDVVQRRYLQFTSECDAALASAEVVFLAVDTPTKPDGSADLRELWIATDLLAPDLPAHSVLVIKTDVPVGTNQRIADRLDRLTWRTFDVVSNPVTVRSENWLDNIFTPPRIVLGCRQQGTADRLRRLYAGTKSHVVVTTPEAAEEMSVDERTPYADATAQATLALRIQETLGDNLSGMKFAIWGLPPRAGMPSRASRELCLVEWLVKRGATVAIHDPQLAAARHLRSDSDRLQVVAQQVDAIKHADALVILKTPGQYRAADPGCLAWHLRSRLIFDGCRCLDPARLGFSGFRFFDLHVEQKASGERALSFRSPTVPFARRSSSPVALAHAG